MDYVFYFIREEAFSKHTITAESVDDAIRDYIKIDRDSRIIGIDGMIRLVAEDLNEDHPGYDEAFCLRVLMNGPGIPYIEQYKNYIDNNENTIITMLKKLDIYIRIFGFTQKLSEGPSSIFSIEQKFTPIKSSNKK